MKKQYKFIKCMLMLTLFQLNLACSNGQTNTESTVANTEIHEIVLGNAQTNKYLPLLENKRVAIVANHTSFIGNTHLVDSLLSLGIDLKKVFSPEHGFRGDADAGEKVKNEVDLKTGLSIISLYGKNKKPSAQQLNNVDVILFDIQDVGVRFYTYISTLHYVMEAAAELKKEVIVLDRPNPNGHYVDGPILQNSQKSFVGLHPVPVVHGMTVGEYAQMINGENWLKNKIQTKLKVIACQNYSHQKAYELQKAPSPNLPNMRAVYLYPSICFFEGTPISVGRGTDKPFQQIGHPSLKTFQYHFTPEPNFGAKQPKLNSQKCFGIDLSGSSNDELRSMDKLDISYLLAFYKHYKNKDKFFTNFFNLLSGNTQLKESIIAGKSESEIRAEWKSGLEKYRIMRKNYLLYP